MASADLSEELKCSLCLESYIDPVSLRCGHNFCRVCIDRVLDSQEGSAGYSCPECREKYKERPGLQTNIALRNIAERFLSTQPDQELAGVHCTYCVDSPVPAVISCVLCDASMCDKHLRVHSKAPEHVLCAPTSSPETRKCSVHKKILEYYCTEDAACVCVSCTLAGEHRGHQVETLQEASEKKKKKLRNDLQTLMTETEEAEKRVQSLEESRRKAQEKADGEAVRVTALFRDLRRRLEELEERVLSDITRRVQCYDDIIRQLEIKKAELSRNMRHIEELCHMTDPLTVLQESDTGDLCDTEDRHDKQLHDGGDLDVASISHTLHTGLADIMSGVTGGISVQPADILLDLNTACYSLHMSDDRKTVSWSPWQNYPATPQRLQDYSQVLSSRSFSSGRHYWEVDVGGSDIWRVGMCYPSIDRRGEQSGIGGNNKSWGLCRWGNEYSVIHDRKEIVLPDGIPSDRVRIYLDYEAGQISFYALCDPIRHLHTFTATFTEPLHAGLLVMGGYIKMSGGMRLPAATMMTVGDLMQSLGGQKEEWLPASGSPRRMLVCPKLIFLGFCLLTTSCGGDCPVECKCIPLDRGSLRVDCSFKNLNSLPSFPKETAELLLQGNQITAVPAGAFDNLVDFKKLNLSSNPLHCDCTIRCDEEARRNGGSSGGGGIRELHGQREKRTSAGRLSLSFPLLLPVMASADLSEELECSVCLAIYTDPVMLRCGHNFCRVCIDRALNSQEGSGDYSCPQCRKRFRDRPELQTNIALRNIAEHFMSTQPDQEEAGVHCTYCIHSPVPAVMSCLHCDAYMCDKHLRVHSKAPEHVLCAPTTSPETRKCSVHKEILEYYCTEDAACVCVSCTLALEHRGHQVETLQEASEKKKEKLRNDLQTLMAETEEAEKRVQSLEERRRKVQEKAAGEAERVTALFRDLRRRLEELEKRVLSDITRRVQCYDDIIRQLEIKKAELSRKMRHIEELCHMTDPLTVLQGSDTGDLCDTEGRHDKQLHDGEDLDVAGISHTLHTGLADIMSGVTGGIYIYIQPADILLDVNTAGNKLLISADRKTASRSPAGENRPETPERFQYNIPQVLSSQSFSSGRHYWEVDVGGSEWWAVGMCYPSIARGGEQSLIGYNNKSWGLYRWGNQCSVIHDRKVIQLPDGIPSDRVRIYLDYEAGQISFYALCDPIRHLHTCITTFTEPLHAGIYVYRCCIKISGRSQGV
ncbi:uncharacterized protein [Hyperolius riggenbachi]|uniref:uncharacterized protein n=1 Tax=Hyperolius riggenbachi TaxID=752182 RepID=UPI0035A2B079